MKLVVRAEADNDLDNIAAWIAKDNPSAATVVVRKIRLAIGRLAIPAIAEMGRPGHTPGTRELVNRPHVVVYKIDEQQSLVEVLAVFHSRQNR